jgi:hypothetical protein
MSGALVAGLLLVVGAVLGAGPAAADTPANQPCSRALLPLLTGTEKQLCAAALGLTSSVSGTVQEAPRVVQGEPQVVPRVVQIVPRVVSGTSGGTIRPQTPSSPSSAGTAGSTGTRAPARVGGNSAAAAPRPAGVAPMPVGVPVAPTQDYDRLLSSAPDRVPSGLLAPAGPAGAAPSLLASFAPGLLAPARPARVLAPENGVTTRSTAGPAFYTAGERIGTPMLVGVLVLASALALAVRSTVLRRARRTA